MSRYRLCYQKNGELKYIPLHTSPGQTHSEFEQAVKESEKLESGGIVPKKQWCVLNGNDFAYAKDVSYYRDNLAKLLNLPLPTVNSANLETKVEEKKHSQNYSLSLGFFSTILSFLK